MATRIQPKEAKAARRTKTAGYTHAKADARQNKKRAEATARQAEYDGLTPAQQEERDALRKQDYNAKSFFPREEGAEVKAS